MSCGYFERAFDQRSFEVAAAVEVEEFSEEVMERSCRVEH